jgi:hypothetical protein
MTLGLPLLGLYSVSSSGFSVDEDDLTILGILASLDVEDFIEQLSVCFMINLEDLLCLSSIFLRSWETSLFVDELMMLCDEI